MTGRTALLSFLDVVSCGLGAAILLFLIYVASPQGGDSTEAAPVESAPSHETEVPELSIRQVHIVVPVELVRAASALRWMPEVPEHCQSLTTSTGLPDGGHRTYLLVCPNGGLPPGQTLSLGLADDQSQDIAEQASVTVRAEAFDGERQALRHNADGQPIADGWHARVSAEDLGELVTFDLSDVANPVRFGGSR